MEFHQKFMGVIYSRNRALSGLSTKNHILFKVIILAMILVVTWPGRAESKMSKKRTRRVLHQKAEYVPGEVLILRAEVAGKRTASEKRDRNLRIRGRIRGSIMKRRALRQRGREVLRIKLPKDKTVQDVLAEQWGKMDSGILAVEPNYRVHAIEEPNDPRFGEMWSLNNIGQTGGATDADIDAPEAWDTPAGTESIIVAVIDTGVDYAHEDLAENMWVNPGEIPHNGIDDDNNGYVDDIYGYDWAYGDNNPLDGDGHGTHVAGTIGAVISNNVGIAGISRNCRIMACKFLDDNGTGNTDDAIEAINYAVANGAQVLNNSWGGGGYSATLEAAIADVRDKGIVFVAAAGNDYEQNNDMIPFYPSSYTLDNIISVASTDHNDNLSIFSNLGPVSVDIGAPGSSILSTLPGNNYGLKGGTSMAAPHVSGVTALLLNQDPNMPLRDLKSRLMWSGDSIGALEGITVTGLRLNASNALAMPAGLVVKAANGGENWAGGGSYIIRWSSVEGSATVDINLLKGGGFHSQITSGAVNTGEFLWTIPTLLPLDTDYRIQIFDGENIDESDADFALVEPGDYFTEEFTGGGDSFNLANKSVLFTPDGTAKFYSACIANIDSLPTNPTGGTMLNLDDDDSLPVSPSGGTVIFYGDTYSSFYVGSNGFITFGESDFSFQKSLPIHFSAKRISGLFDDLDPTSGGMVSWKELADRVAVSWENVPQFGESDSNTFQVEMFFDGRIQISWLSVGASDAIVGLSEGQNVPGDYVESHFTSDYGDCIYEPVCGDINHPYPEGDLNEDCIVDMGDLNIVLANWLECTKPECD